MTPNVVILCAAGMLVTAYLMVGQKSLFTTIRLYGVQSLLLATVAVVMAISDKRPHLFVMATMTTVLKGFAIPLFPNASVLQRKRCFAKRNVSKTGFTIFLFTAFSPKTLASGRITRNPQSFIRPTVWTDGYNPIKLI